MGTKIELPKMFRFGNWITGSRNETFLVVLLVRNQFIGLVFKSVELNIRKGTLVSFVRSDVVTVIGTQDIVFGEIDR